MNIPKRKQEHDFPDAFSYEAYIDELYLELQAVKFAILKFCSEPRRDELISQFMKRFKEKL
jgi:hypothetical protein